MTGLKSELRNWQTDNTPSTRIKIIDTIAKQLRIRCKHIVITRTNLLLCHSVPLHYFCSVNIFSRLVVASCSLQRHDDGGRL